MAAAGAHEDIDRSRPDVSTLGKPIKQWVERVISFSSEYGAHSYAASQVIGKSNVYPEYGDHATSWAQENLTKEEYIEVAFQKKVYIEQVDIYETYHCGAVVRIKAKQTNGQWYTLWEAEAPQRITEPRIFSPNIVQCNFLSNVLRVDLDCTADDSPQWCEIDAIRIHGKTSNLVPPPPSALGESLKSLVNNKNLSDVVFDVQGVTVFGHRNILAARSEFFKDLFKGYTDPKKVIQIPKLSVCVFVGVLQYLYTGAIDYSVTDTQLVEIVRVCTIYYNLPELATLCNCYIQADMTVDNVIPILKEASKPGEEIEATRAICFEFCRDHFAEVSMSENFRTLSQELMVELVQKATGAVTLQ